MLVHSSAWRPGFLALLLLVGLSQATQATLGTYLRASVLSWDSPLSQQKDQISSQAVPWADASGEWSARSRAAAAAIQRLGFTPDDPLHATAARSSGITRSPPIA
jgi:hypothetical protein